MITVAKGFILLIIPPANEVQGGYIEITLSVRLSVCLSVRLSVQIRVRPITFLWFAVAYHIWYMDVSP